MTNIWKQSSKKLAAPFLLKSRMTVADLVKRRTELCLNSLVGRTANEYFKWRKLEGRKWSWFTMSTKIIVNQSLYRHYSTLWSKTKRLQSMGKINFIFFRETAKNKSYENSKPISIIHLDHWADNISGINFSLPTNAS